MEILLENFRCFSGKHKIHISPLTLLVGENSTGKSAFLSAVCLMGNAKRFPLKPAFNQAPFELGDYDSIATQKKKGVAGSFAVGFNKTVKGADISAKATYGEKNGHVSLEKFQLRTEVGSVMVECDEGMNVVAEIHMNGEGGVKIQAKGSHEETSEIPDLRSLFLSLLLPTVLEEVESQIKSDQNKKSDTEARFRTTRALIEHLSEIVEHIVPFKDAPLAIAPIRSKPRRTYDTYDEDFDPEGSHIPLRLTRIYESKGKRYLELKAAIRRFGRNSGLYTDIVARRIGKKPSSAFQVFVKTGNSEMNIIDVGYGVSQCLPIVVQSFMSSPEQPIVLQQPEVHLHPKAQAALGSLFVDLAAKHDKELLIETHSDYLIDRIRMEVAKGKIDPSIVTILFFERARSRSKVFEIGLDANGNIKNAPPSYRRFFLEEEDALISRGG